MSNEVDQRVVEMKFDNRNFEKNVSTSMNTLKKFKESLKFEGAVKGMDELNNSAQKFSLNPMADAVDKVEVKFNALSVAAISAISRIVDKAMDAGVRLVKSLSTDNIIAGWNKLNDKTSSIQTIMNATGLSIEEVNGYLERLMWFSDETSYGFNDMTRAIATMTSSGGDIKKVIPMVQGVANAVAFAGKSASEFSRVMEFSVNQAYSLGYLGTLDWKTIQQAGVGSKQLKETFISVAETMGKIEKGTVDITNFASTLKDKWLDTEVMEAAFGYFSEMSDMAYEMVKSGEVDTAAEAYEILGQRFNDVRIQAATAAQSAKTFSEVMDYTKDAVGSGWMKTFELIFGNYEQAKELYTQLAEEFYQLFVVGGERRNKILSEGLQDGLQQLQDVGLPNIENFKTALLKAAEASGTLDDSMKEMINLDFNKSLKEGWVTQDILTDALLDSVEAIHRYDQAQLESMGYTEDDIKAIRRFSDALFSGQINLEEYTKKLVRLSGRDNLVTAFWNLWNSLFAIESETSEVVGIFTTFKNAISELFPPITGEKVYQFTVKLRELTEGMGLTIDQADGLKNILKALFTPIKWIVDLAGKGFKLVGKLVGHIGKLAGSFLTLFKNATPAEVILRKLFGDTKGTAIINAFKNAVSHLKDEFGRLKEKLHDAWDAFKESDQVKGILERIKAALQPILSMIGDKILNALHAIANIDFISVLNSIKSGALDFVNLLIRGFNTIKQWIKELDWSSLTGWFSSIGSIFQKIGQSLNIKVDKETPLGKFIQKLKEETGSLPEILNRAKTAILEFAKNLTPAKILIFAFGVVLVSLLSSINKVANSAANLVSNISSIFATLRKTFVKTSPILQFATAIGVLTTALYVLSTVPVDDLKAAAVALAGMMGAVVVFIGIMTLLSKVMANPITAVNMALLAKSTLKMASAVAVLAAALVILSKVDATNIVAQVGALGLAMLEFAVFARIVGAVSPALAKTGIGLIALAGSVLVLTLTLRQLEKIDPTKMVKAVVGLAPVFAALIALGLAARLGTTKGAIGLMLMTVNIGLLVKALQKLDEVSPERLLKVMPQFILICVSMSLLMTAAMNGGRYAGRAGVAALAMSGAVLIIIQAIKQLGDYPAQNLKQGLTAVMALMGIFTAFMALSKLAGKNVNRVSLSFFAMAAAITLLVIPIKAIGNMDADAAKQGAIVVGGLLTLFTILMAVSKLSSKATAAIIAMSFTIGMLSAALVLLTLPNYDDLLSAAKAMGLVLLGLAAALGGMSLMMKGGTGLTKKGKILAIIEAVVAVGLLLTMVTTAMNKLPSNLSGQQMQGFGVGVAAIMASISVAMLAMGKMPANINLKQVGLSLLEFTGVAAVLIGATTAFAAIFASDGIKKLMAAEGSMDSIINGLIVMGAVGTEIAAVTGILAGIAKLTKGVDISGITTTVLGFGEVLAVLIVAVGGLSLLYAALTDGLGVSPEAITDALNGAVEVFAAVGEAVGKLVGGIVGGGIEQILTDFGEGIAAFFNAFGIIDADKVGNLKTLAEAMKEFAMAGLADFLGTMDLAKLGEDLDAFIPFLINFAQQVNGIEFSGVESATNAAKGFGEFLNALPREGGLVGTIIGDHQSLQEFSKGLPWFGKCITAMQESLPKEGIDEGLIQTAVNAGKMISELEKNLPREGGALQQFIGEYQNMEQFGQNMKIFGQAITEFSAQVQDKVSEDAVSAAANGGMMLAKLENTLPRSGGKLQTFMGEVDMVKFASDMRAFGYAVVQFSSQVQDKINEDAVSAAANAGMMLAELENKLPATGGKLQDFLGEQNLQTFSSGILSLGGSLVLFSSRVQDLNMDSVNAAIAVADGINQIALTLGDGKVVTFFKGKDTLESFGSQLVKFGGKIKEFGDKISGTQWAEIDRAADSIMKLANISSVLDSFKSSNVKQFQDGLAQMARDGINAFTDTFGGADTETLISDTGLKFVTSFAASINNAIESPMEIEARRMIGVFCVYFISAGETQGPIAAEGFIDAITDGIYAQSGALHEAGEYVVEGIMQGIELHWSTFEQFMTRKAGSIVSTFESALLIQSPSKVMRDQVGRYIVEGIAEGIKDDMSAEEQAAKKAENIVSVFQDSFKAHETELKAAQLTFEKFKLENPFMSKKDSLGKQLDELAKEVGIGRKRLDDEIAKFEAISKAVDHTTNEYKDAQNNMTQAWIDYEKTMHEYANLQATAVEPKLVFKETGETVLEGFLYGLTSDMTLEDAMAQKAENIITAFEQSFTSHDFSTTLKNMQADMWSIANPAPSGTSETKANKEKYESEQKIAEVIKNKMAIEDAADQVRRAQAKYDAVVKVMGEDSDKAREIYLELVEQQQTLMSLAAERRKYETDTSGYATALAKVNEMTEEEIDHYFDIADNNPIKLIYDAALDAAKDYGEIQFDFEDFFAPLTDQESLSKIGEGVEVVFKEDIPEAILESMGPITDAASYVGTEIGDAMGNATVDAWWANIKTGFKTGNMNLVSGTLNDVLQNGTGLLSGGLFDQITHTGEILENTLMDVGNSQGTNYTDSFGGAVENGWKKAEGVLSNTVGKVGSFVNGLLGIGSPSKVAEQQGKWYVIGFCLGLTKLLYMVRNAGEAIADDAIDSVENIVARIDQILQGDLDFAPSISPVLDLSGIYDSASQLGNVLNVDGTYTLASGAFEEAEAARMSREEAMTQWLVDSIGNQIAGLHASLDDMRQVVESHGKNDLIVNIDVDGNEFARATVPDYLLASRANGTPFWEPASTFK